MKNGIDFNHANTPTPTPSQTWLQADAPLRQKLCQDLINTHFQIDVLSTNIKGEITVAFRNPVTAAERGPLLLNCEALLKNLDSALVVYLQAKEDKNALRKFRGILINDNA